VPELRGGIMTEQRKINTELRLDKAVPAVLAYCEQCVEMRLGYHFPVWQDTLRAGLDGDDPELLAAAARRVSEHMDKELKAGIKMLHKPALALRLALANYEKDQIIKEFM
jgi:hypothetical protein